MNTKRIGSALSLSLVLAVACATVASKKLPDVPPPVDRLDGSAYETAMRVNLPKTAPYEQPSLHNVFQLSGDVISGSEPHGEEAFRKLAEMGVKTVLSVDGKAPDIELAKKYGMSYVHVPIQYRGIADLEMTQIAKTFREKEGPFYVHCFHGKHRGPAAAAVGRVVLDGVPREQAIAEMRQWCGTSPSYEGLYLAIASGPIPESQATSSYAWDFPERHPFDGFRATMIEISRADDNLKYLSKHDWKPTPDHPDVDPVNEAVKLADAFELSATLNEVANRPPDFRAWMEDSVKQSADLCDSLRKLEKGEATVEHATAAYKALARTCTACHDVYRND
jgi:protein tyrosine phosphatase (PTP) superfamily phosphohydrolase (DUF442 family)